MHSFKNCEDLLSLIWCASSLEQLIGVAATLPPLYSRISQFDNFFFSKYGGVLENWRFSYDIYGIGENHFSSQSILLQPFQSPPPRSAFRPSSKLPLTKTIIISPPQLCVQSGWSGEHCTLMVMVVDSTTMWMTSLKTRSRLMEDTLTALWALEDIVGDFEGDGGEGGGSIGEEGEEEEEKEEEEDDEEEEK